MAEHAMLITDVAALKVDMTALKADNEEMKADLNSFYLMWAGARAAARATRKDNLF